MTAGAVGCSAWLGDVQTDAKHPHPHDVLEDVEAQRIAGEDKMQYGHEVWNPVNCECGKTVGYTTRDRKWLRPDEKPFITVAFVVSRGGIQQPKGQGEPL